MSAVTIDDLVKVDQEYDAAITAFIKAVAGEIGTTAERMESAIEARKNMLVRIKANTDLGRSELVKADHVYDVARIAFFSADVGDLSHAEKQLDTARERRDQALAAACSTLRA